MSETAPSVDETYTLLGVRADGVASIVDLVPASSLDQVRSRARALLNEHESCRTIEIWIEGSLLEQHGR
jgi:hypothetical protein